LAGAEPPALAEAGFYEPPPFFEKKDLPFASTRNLPDVVCFKHSILCRVEIYLCIFLLMI